MRAGLISILVALAAALPGRGAAAQDRPRVSAEVYEGWRQYSVHCARCHGQDVLGNPVAANLLKSVAPGGPAAGAETFTAVVAGGRPDRGMPGFKEHMSAEQIAAVYAYVRGRAEGKVPAGRPSPPAG